MKKRDTRTAEIFNSSLDPCSSSQSLVRILKIFGFFSVFSLYFSPPAVSFFKSAFFFSFFQGYRLFALSSACFYAAMEEFIAAISRHEFIYFSQIVGAAAEEILAATGCLTAAREICIAGLRLCPLCSLKVLSPIFFIISSGF